MAGNCEQHSGADPASADNIYDYTKYNRFILVKSDTAFESGIKISDFAQLPQEGDVYHHVFGFGSIAGWEMIKVSNELDDAYYYNIAYWLLGFGDDDPNHADKSVIVLTDKETSEVKYVGLIDSEITKIEDSMLLLSNRDEQFIVEIPFHTFKTVDNKFDYSVSKFLENNSITAADFKEAILKTVSIKFNEKIGR